MCGNAEADYGCRGAADRVGVGFDTEIVNIGQALVKAAFISETVLGTADTAVTGLDRKRYAFIPAHR
jgi:hypothetical protein